VMFLRRRLSISRYLEQIACLSVMSTRRGQDWRTLFFNLDGLWQSASANGFVQRFIHSKDECCVDSPVLCGPWPHRQLVYTCPILFISFGMGPGRCAYYLKHDCALKWVERRHRSSFRLQQALGQACDEHFMKLLSNRIFVGNWEGQKSHRLAMFCYWFFNPTTQVLFKTALKLWTKTTMGRVGLKKDRPPPISGISPCGRLRFPAMAEIRDCRPHMGQQTQLLEQIKKIAMLHATLRTRQSKSLGRIFLKNWFLLFGCNTRYRREAIPETEEKEEETKFRLLSWSIDLSRSKRTKLQSHFWEKTLLTIMVQTRFPGTWGSTRPKTLTLCVTSQKKNASK